MPAEDATWLTETFSRKGLRALTDRHLVPRDVPKVRLLAELNLTRLRGYVSKTTLSLSDIEWLMDRNVGCRDVTVWEGRRAPEFTSENLTTALSIATLFHGVPDGDVAGWVRYANQFNVPFEGTVTSPWRFLGGDTALMALAGVSPVEARTLTDGGKVNRAALTVLAGLRGGGHPR